jgi:hypothetical protein
MLLRRPQLTVSPDADMDQARWLTSRIPSERGHSFQASIGRRCSQKLVINERLTLVLVHEDRQQLSVVSLRAISERSR